MTNLNPWDRSLNNAFGIFHSRGCLSAKAFTIPLDHPFANFVSPRFQDHPHTPCADHAVSEFAVGTCIHGMLYNGKNEGSVCGQTSRLFAGWIFRACR